MTGYRPSTQRTDLLSNIEDWMSQRNADVRRLGGEAEAAGRAAWAQATRTGQNIAATKPSDVAALGVRAISQAGRRARAAVQSGAQAMGEAVGGRSGTPLWHGAVEQLRAGTSGAEDAFTFGLGDRAVAGTRALLDAAHGADLGRAFGSHMADERAQDQYDAAHYGVARNVGQVLGTGAQIAALGPLEGLVGGVARIPQATAFLARETAALGAVGGVIGVGGQAITDLARGRVSSAGDYGGAALGGAVGGVASRWLGAGHSGALGGVVTSLAQDRLNGRQFSFDRAHGAAILGGVMGAAGGRLGQRLSDDLPIAMKGQLGEDMSRARTWLRGDKVLAEAKRAEPLEAGGYTIPDHLTQGGETVEAKFGPFARLSRRQLQAFDQPLSNYRVDHFLPRDFGAVVGFPAALGGYDGFLAASPTRPM